MVYRRGRSFAHVGIVRYRTAGLPVMVEGKWGFGGVYLHPVERAVYGTAFGYCRSPRRGQLLNGLGTAGSASARKSDAIPEDETE